MVEACEKTNSVNLTADRCLNFVSLTSLKGGSANEIVYFMYKKRFEKKKSLENDTSRESMG